MMAGFRTRRPGKKLVLTLLTWRDRITYCLREITASTWIQTTRMAVASMLLTSAITLPGNVGAGLARMITQEPLAYHRGQKRSRLSGMCLAVLGRCQDGITLIL